MVNITLSLDENAMELQEQGTTEDLPTNQPSLNVHMNYRYKLNTKQPTYCGVQGTNGFISLSL